MSNSILERATSTFDLKYWIIFLGVLIIILLLDIIKLIKEFNDPEIKIKKQLKADIMHFSLWGILIIIFIFFLYYFIDLPTKNQSHLGVIPSNYAIDFITAYFIELTLSVDNIFVFILIFKHFKLSHKQEKIALYIGIFSAIVLRFIMITFGIYIVWYFHYAFYIFGAILLWAGYKMLKSSDTNEKDLENDLEDKIENNLAIKLLKRFINFSYDYNGSKVLIRKNGKLYGTKLLIVIILIETADIIFAIDSIPAVMAITTEPFIVFTSNILAIIGLRSIFFIVNTIISKLKYIKYGLSIILIFIGLKMILSMQGIIISTHISLIFVILTLFISGLASKYHR